MIFTKDKHLLESVLHLLHINDLIFSSAEEYKLLNYCKSHAMWNKIEIYNFILYIISCWIVQTTVNVVCFCRYDPQTDAWTAVAPMSISRDAVGVCLLGDRLYAVGGYDGQVYLNTVEAYDPQTNEWTQVLYARTVNTNEVTLYTHTVDFLPLPLPCIFACFLYYANVCFPQS